MCCTLLHMRVQLKKRIHFCKQKVKVKIYALVHKRGVIYYICMCVHVCIKRMLSQFQRNVVLLYTVHMNDNRVCLSLRLYTDLSMTLSPVHLIWLITLYFCNPSSHSHDHRPPRSFGRLTNNKTALRGLMQSDDDAQQL